MIILVTGTRFATTAHAQVVAKPLAWVASGRDQVTLWHGANAGVDTIAGTYGNSRGWNVVPFDADWTGPCRDQCRPGHRANRNGRTYCPAAGVYRNAEMVAKGPTITVGFPLRGGKPSRGTMDCVRRSIDAGLPTLVFPLTP